ncbi:RelA/SpoT domain-containing protein [Salmonirosea aquatica]|uniref:(P)ppGpp synthetase n=1 Tax=Salmonirosea aquatica TaxID=2654236 RepID=A0A7C9BKM7_9BACT|nr:(p)ppGpp synthetase [Cytophagaceae bacterium SJW1-29]
MALKDNILIFSKRQIDDAGNILANPSSTQLQRDQALEALGNFRSCHAYPINTFQATLRKKLNKTGIEYLVSQRLKRTPSIILKLERFQNMRLSQMQDIGGIRAILPTMNDVNTIVTLYRKAGLQHEIKNEKDYIQNPKDSGYRCFHIVYKYKNSINPNYDNLMVELQIRTRLQHAWATAVETMGTFIDHSLKSSQGPMEWLDFFSLVGNAFAYIENTPNLLRYSHYTRDEVFEKVRKDANYLQVINQLEAFSNVIANIETDKRQGSLHLVVLDVKNKEVRIKTYSRTAIEEASADYLKEETSITDSNKRQVVLVSSNSLDSLRKAYPSYFLDTQEFIRTLKEIITI